MPRPLLILLLLLAAHRSWQYKDAEVTAPQL